MTKSMYSLVFRRPSTIRSLWCFAQLVTVSVALTSALFAATYNTLIIPQNGTVQIGSASENLSLIMQGDGNLVLYQNGVALWATSTAGQNCGASACFAAFQSDGNFVVYNGSSAIWSSGTAGNAGASLVLSDQLPHIEIVGSNQSIFWSDAFTFSTGNFRVPEGSPVDVGGAFFFLQDDGNLVLYQGSLSSIGPALWSSGSSNQNCAGQCFVAFQGDGNLVIYNGSTAIWSSGTAGNPSALLLLSPQPPYVAITGTLMPRFAAKEYIYLGGRVVAIENP